MAQMALQSLQSKVDRARSYWRALMASEGSLWTMAAVVLVFVLFFHVDRLLVLSVEARVGVWAILGLLFTCLMI